MDQILPNDIWFVMLTCMGRQDLSTVRAIAQLNKSIRSILLQYLKHTKSVKTQNNGLVSLLPNGIPHGRCIHASIGKSEYENAIDVTHVTYFWGHIHGLYATERVTSDGSRSNLSYTRYSMGVMCYSPVPYERSAINEIKFHYNGYTFRYKTNDRYATSDPYYTTENCIEYNVITLPWSKDA
jgi:hypothetical protein